jgi:hypothetical protein
LVFLSMAGYGLGWLTFSELLAGRWEGGGAYCLIGLDTLLIGSCIGSLLVSFFKVDYFGKGFWFDS